MIGIVSYVLLSSVYLRLLSGSHNSLEIEQCSEKISWGLKFFFSGLFTFWTWCLAERWEVQVAYYPTHN